MFVEGVKIINTQYRVFTSDDLILKTSSSFFIFCTNSKNFCTKIIEKAAEEKIKDLVPKKNSTRSFCNIMRLVW